MLYLLLSIVAGYAAARLKGTSEGWKSVSLYTTFFFPGIVVLAVYSTRAKPISFLFSLMCIWFGISVPLTLIGGFIATKKPVPHPQRRLWRLLSVEDWRWWWKAFFTCGSIGVYVLVDSVKDVVFELIGPVSAAVCAGDSLVMAVAVMLATGTFDI